MVTPRNAAASSTELVRQREDERDASPLVSLIDCEDVQADALRLGGVVQQAVLVGLLERCADRICEEVSVFAG